MTEISRKMVSNAMKEVGVQLNSNLLNKCVSTCSSLNIEPSQIAESWEAYSLNKNISILDEHSFASFRQSLIRDLEQNMKMESQMENKSSILSVQGIMKRSREEESLMTPERKQHKRVVSPSFNAYEQRKGAGTTTVTYNPNNLEPILSSDTNKLCTRIKLYGNQNVVKPYRYMFTTLDQRAEALDDHLNQIQDVFFEKEDIPNYEAIGVPKQDQVTVIGRVCNDAHIGRINKTSVLLEAPRHQNGIRVNLQLDHMKTSYSLFPGQIVKAEGINSSGRTMVATSITEGSPLPLPKTRAKELLKLQHLGKTQGRPLQIMTACGPFTTSNNLNYEPFVDFIMGIVRENKPDVVILMGPFVDMRHSMVQSGKIELPIDEDCVISVSYETLFFAKITSVLEELFEAESDLITQIIIVPSLDDAVSEPVYPQPPMVDRIPGGKLTDLPFSEGIEIGTLSMQTIENISSSLPSEHKRIHCVSNPCTIQLNEVVIGMTSTDTLLHISSDETNANLMGNRMTRIAQHLIQQRSFYPLFPPPNGAQLDLIQMNQYQMPCTPDILIVPSKLACFSKNVSGCVVVNPGHLGKGTVGGTYGTMAIYPMDRNHLEETDSDVQLEHGIHNRIRVDIKKI